MNIYAPFVARARTSPHAVAVLTPRGVLTYAELERAVSWTAAGLRRAGVASGDHVGILLMHQVQYLVTSLALAEIGAGQLALQPRDPPKLIDELRRKLKLVGTVAAQPSGIAGSRIEPPPASLGELKALGGHAADLASDGSLPFMLKRSSGTTSAMIKIAILTHAMGVPPAAAFPRELPRGADCRFLPFPPLSFAAAMNHVPRVLSNGSCLALADGITEPGAMVEFIRQHRINFVAGGPTHAAALLMAAKPGSLLLPGLALRVGTTLVHDELRRAILGLLTHNLYVMYSISETGGLSAAAPALVRRQPGTVGHAMPGVQIEIMDEEGKALPPGKRGRLRARTPWMVRGYVDDPEETRRAFRDGWFYSGDLVEMRSDGELIHHGRADDMMIFDGLNITPAEIEQTLLRHAAVAEAAAFGIPSNVRGSIPVAAVVLKAKCTIHELHGHCASWLGALRPVEIIVLPSLPRNAVGKVLTRELVSRYRAARKNEAVK